MRILTPISQALALIMIAALWTDVPALAFATGGLIVVVEILVTAMLAQDMGTE